MPGFNVPPMPNLPPELLAAMAKGAFRPPGLMGTAGGMMPPQAAPGFNVGAGADMVSQGLAGFRPSGGGSPLTPGAVMPGAAPIQPGQMLSTSAIDRANDSSLGTPMPPVGALSSLIGGGGSAGGGSGAASGGAAAGGLGMASMLPFAYAAGIGFGKNTEANHPGTPVGDTSLALLGPSIPQIIKDPKGMGLPALLGVPFLAPFFASKEAKAAKPEWSFLGSPATFGA